MNDADLIALILRYLDADMTPDEERELAGLLRENAEGQVLLVRLSRLHGRMADAFSAMEQMDPLGHEHAPDGAKGQHFGMAQSIQRGSWFWHRAVWLSLAASLALMVGGWWLAQSRPPVGLGLKVVEVAGTAAIEKGKLGIEDWKTGTPGTGTGVQSPPRPIRPTAPASTAGSRTLVRPGDILRPGDGVEVGADGFVKLAYTDGTRVELERNTRLRVTRGEGEHRDAKRLALDAGKMLCEAARQRKAFEIRTPHATARVVGTQFGLEVVDDKTRLAVTEGQVAVERSGQTLLVGSNQTAEASGDGLKMMPPQIALVGTVIKKLMAQLESPGRDGIAFDGRVLWMNTFASNVLVKVDPVSGKCAGRLEVNSEATPLHMMNGLAWDGTHLWVSAVEDATLMSKNRICAVDPATGRVIKTFDLPSGFGASGVAAGDGHLWCMALARDRADVARVFKLDSSSGAVAASWPVPPEAGGKCGLEYMDGAVWVVNWKKVWKLDAEDGSVIGVFDTPEPIYDLAQSGIAGQMWMLGRMSLQLLLVEIREGP